MNSKKPHILGTRIISKKFTTDLAGNVPLAASTFSMAVKQTFKRTKVRMFERVGRTFYAEFQVSV